jgi:hypothetical protein
MRHLPFLLLSAAFSAAAFAQDRPPRLEPLPEAPPPPVIRDGADDPRVVIQGPQQGDKIEEVREGGRVVMMKVTPPNGIPYYLLDTLGTGTWTRTDALDPGVRVPMWSIKQFD